MAADHGTDFHCVTDIDPTMRVVSGRECLLESIARRLITPSGGLFGSVNYGYDTRRWLNASHPLPYSEISAAVAAEAEKEKRVASADASVEFNEETKTMTITYRIIDADGPFDATISISEVTVDLVLEGTELS